MADTTRTGGAFRGSRVLWGPGEREMKLRQIQDRLEENGAAIGRIEAYIAEHPVELGSLRPMLEVLEKMKKNIEADWLDVADQRGGSK